MFQSFMGQRVCYKRRITTEDYFTDLARARTRASTHIRTLQPSIAHVDHQEAGIASDLAFFRGGVLTQESSQSRKKHNIGLSPILQLVKICRDMNVDADADKVLLALEMLTRVGIT